MNEYKCRKIFEILEKTYIKNDIQLKYSTSFELLISVILSAKTKDDVVNKSTYHLFKQANTPYSIYKLGINKLMNLIKSINFYKNKAKYIIQTCEYLINHYNENIPNTRQELELLPGVGRKSSNIILNVLFNKKTIAVDTHVFRLSNRLNLVSSKSFIQVEKKLLHIIPNKYIKKAHNIMISHGKQICKSINPKCNQCVLYKYCEYKHKILKIS